MKTYNVAVIGFGFMGRTHSYAYDSIKYYYPDAPFRARLYAVCGRDIEKTERVAKTYGFEYATDDYEKILSDPNVDIIDICTPNALHYDEIKRAIAAGKSIYCDKPLAATYTQAKELAALAKEHGICGGMTFQNRCFPAVIRAKQLIDEGRLGDIVSFRAAYLHSSLTDPEKPYSWRLSPLSEGGGVLMDLGTHIIDMVTYLCGDIESVDAVMQTAHTTRPDGKGGRVDIECDDAAYMVAVLKDGAVGTIEASKLALGVSDSLRVEIHGRCGALRFDLARPGDLEFYDGTDTETPYGGDAGFKKIECLQKYPDPCSFLNGKVQPGWIRAHIHSVYNFLDALHNGRTPSPSFDDGANVQRIIELARE